MVPFKDGEVYFEDQRAQGLALYKELKPVSIEETVTWMYNKYADAGVSAETPVAKWYAGDRLDMDEALYIMCQPSLRTVPEVELLE